MNNKAINEFGFHRIYKNYADLEGCYPPWPSVSVNSTFLDLHNSSNPTHDQPHSLIANYSMV